MLISEKAHRNKEFMKQVKLLYENFYRQLYLYALTFMDNEEEAKDIVSDVFSILWEKWQNENKYIEPTLSFLYTMVRNKCFDQIRHSKAKERYNLLMASTEVIENEEKVREYEQRITDLTAAIDKLPPQDQMILKCCYFKRLSYKETAEELNISVTIVHKHMLKIFKTLRDMLKK